MSSGKEGVDMTKSYMHWAWKLTQYPIIDDSSKKMGYGPTKLEVFKRFWGEEENKEKL